jgi:hypothetical protein
MYDNNPSTFTFCTVGLFGITGVPHSVQPWIKNLVCTYVQRGVIVIFLNVHIMYSDHSHLLYGSSSSTPTLLNQINGFYYVIFIHSHVLLWLQLSHHHLFLLPFLLLLFPFLKQSPSFLFFWSSFYI